jgi:polyisoprenoid-binding protein YceI
MLRLLVLASLVSAPAFAANTYKLDSALSKVEWVGTKVTGSHNGLVPVKEGTVEVDKGLVKSANVTVDLANMTNTDLSGEYQTKLLNHLKDDDFFSTNKYPTATIVIKSAKPIKGKQHEFTGDLTIKGITKPVSFKGDVEEGKDTVSVKGNLVFDRTAYGIKYNSGKFFQSLGDKMINDEVKLNFTAVAKK